LCELRPPPMPKRQRQRRTRRKKGEDEETKSREQEPVVALPQRFAKLVDVHIPDCGVAEGDGDGGRERRGEVPGALVRPRLGHRDSSPAMQARL
jgi:hypothetical protein